MDNKLGFIEINKKKYNIAAYQPEGEARDAVLSTLKDFGHGKDIMDNPYREFNDVNLTSKMDECQKVFNNYTPPKSNDPDESWRSREVRPLTRNKVMSIAAHIVSALLYPQVFAQNERQEADRDASVVMRDLMEWANGQADYEMKVLYATLGALVNPVSIVHEEYTEVYREVKEIQEDGSYKKVSRLDEEYSGFNYTSVPADQLYIGNIYEHDIQRQPFLIWRRTIDFTDAKMRYDNERYENFEYVRPGIKYMYSSEDDMFYEQYDEDLQDRLVEEVHYYNRLADLHLIYLNGVLITAPDRPLQRADKKYPFAKFGYGLIDEGEFFYYKSLVDTMLNDQRLLDRMYNMVIDGTFLEIMPALVVYGDEEFDSDIIAPGNITTLSKESKAEMLNVRHNINAGYNALGKIESSIHETSSDPLMSGSAVSGTATAYEISRVEHNAKVVLGLFAKMISKFVEDLGELLLNDIIQYLTIAEIDEISGDQLKYKSFMLSDRIVDGKKGNKRIVLTDDIANREIEPGKITEEEYARLQMDILEQEGDLDSADSIVMVNPSVFRNLKYSVRIGADVIFQNSDAVKKALNLEGYDRMIQNPYVDQELVTRDFLIENYVPGESDKYMKKAEDVMQGMSDEKLPAGKMDVTSQLSGDGANQLAQQIESETSL